MPTEAMKEAISRYILRRSRIVVARHDIDVRAANLLAELPLLDSSSGWAACDLRLLHVGSPGVHKDLPCLAAIFGECRKRHPELRVGLAMTIGEGDRSPEVEGFRDELDSLDCAKFVWWAGKVPHEQVFPLYPNADVLLIPSRVESFGSPV